MSKQIYKSAEVQRISDAVLQVKRSFNASRDLVFKAYTTPSLIKRWLLGPPGWEMPICEMDLREGGKFRWRWRNKSDKSEFGFTGMFREIAAFQKIIHTESFDPGTLGGDMGSESLVTVTFLETDGVTTLTTKIEYQSKEDLEKALSTGMTDGMEMSYKLLDGVLQTT